MSTSGHEPVIHHTGLSRLALDLASQALLITPPNPRVGCVLTSPDGTILGRGHTQRTGGPHAEIMALRDAAAKGNAVHRLEQWPEPVDHF